MTSLLIIGQVTPTLIITQSKPKVFQLTDTKIAIVIDENEDVAIEHVKKVQAQQRVREQEQEHAKTQQQEAINRPQVEQGDQQRWPQVQESQSSGDTYHQAIMGDTKKVQHHTQMFHHQVEATHDDGQSVKTHSQITKYGSVKGQATHTRFQGFGISGLPDSYYSSNESPPASDIEEKKDDTYHNNPSGPVSPSSQVKGDSSSIVPTSPTPVSTTPVDPNSLSPNDKIGSGVPPSPAPEPDSSEQETQPVLPSPVDPSGGSFGGKLGSGVPAGPGIGLPNPNISPAPSSQETQPAPQPVLPSPVDPSGGSFGGKLGSGAPQPVVPSSVDPSGSSFGGKLGSGAPAGPGIGLANPNIPSVSSSSPPTVGSSSSTPMIGSSSSTPIVGSSAQSTQVPRMVMNNPHYTRQTVSSGQGIPWGSSLTSEPEVYNRNSGIVFSHPN